MKVKNLTNTTQRLWLEDVLRGGVNPVEVLPGEVREVAKNYIPDTNRTPNFSQVFSIIVPWNTKVTQETEEHTAVPEIAPINQENEESTDMEDEGESEDPDAGEEDKTSTPVNESKFICDICGAEFGSAQGLSMHKTRSHSSES